MPDLADDHTMMVPPQMISSQSVGALLCLCGVRVYNVADHVLPRIAGC